MVNILNNIIKFIVPLIPKFFIKLIANRYIAGTTTKEALSTIKNINDLNLCATLDILGEHTADSNNAYKISQKYRDLFVQIKKYKLDCNISLKPTHIGSDISVKFFNENLATIIREAEKCNNFLRLDMESSKITELTIKAYKKYVKKHKNIGIVLQAYLKRSINDIDNFKENSNIRLCKGIYNEPKDIAYKDPGEINDNYIELFKKAINKNIYTGIATHDEILIDRCCEIITLYKIPKNLFEFQVLYGVPIENKIKFLQNKGYKVRVYIPYGRDWYKYSLRRINENPNISKYIVKNLFKRNFYK